MDTKKLRKKLVPIAVCAVMLTAIIGGFIGIYSIQDDFARNKLTGFGVTVIGEIVRGSTVEQEIPYHEGDCGVSLRFATYARQNMGKVRVRIVGETSGFVYDDETLSAGKIVDNAYADFMYSEDRPQEDETLKITITSTSTPRHGVTLWRTEDDEIADYSMAIDGEEKPIDLSVQTINAFTRKQYIWPILGLTVICFLVSSFMIFREKAKMETTYLAMALTLGLVFCFVMTPLSIPDEQIHYGSAFRISNAFCFQWDNLDQASGEYFDYHDLGGHYNVGTAYSRILNEFFAPRPTDQEQVQVWGSVNYPIMLIPQAIGLSIGRLLGLNFLMTFYLGRIANLLFYAACVSLAIKKTPRFKMLFFMTGLMPMALQQAASFSYDAFINAMSILLFAFVLRAIDGEGPIQFREILPIAIIGALLSPTKVIYAPMLLIAILIPFKRFRDRKTWFMYMCFIVGISAIMVLLFQLDGIRSVAKPDGPELNWEGMMNYSMSDIIHHPIRMARVFFGTLLALGWDWYLQSIGRMLSGQTMAIKNAFVYVFGVLLLFSSFRHEDERPTSAREKLVFTITGLLPIFLLMFIMLISWTSNTRTTIQGIQGRYFIPVLPLFFMCLRTRLVTVRKPIERYIAFCGLLMDICVLLDVLVQTL